MEISKFGSFYIGGRRIEIKDAPHKSFSFSNDVKIDYNPNGHYHIEQAYVQYFIPKETKFKLPIVFLHGGGLTGSVWEQTPDERSGWAQHFLEKGFVINIVDNVERGRASWTPFEGIWPDDPVVRSAEEAWNLFRIGKPVDFNSKKAFKNQQFPINYWDNFAKFQVPRWQSVYPRAVAAFGDILEKLGKCFIIAHSNGGYIALESAAEHASCVDGLVLLESAGFVTQEKLQKLTDTAMLFVYGDFISESEDWTLLRELGRKCYRELTRAGARATWLELPSQGIVGNSHMLMSDRNSDVVADLVATWIAGIAGEGVKSSG